MHLKLRIKIRMRQLFCMKIDKNFLRAVAMPLKSKVYVKLLEKKNCYIYEIYNIVLIFCSLI